MHMMRKQRFVQFSLNAEQIYFYLCFSKQNRIIKDTHPHGRNYFAI